MSSSPAPLPLPEIAEHEPVIQPSRAKRLYFIVGIAALALLIGYGIYALATSGRQTTDDAEVAADVVPIAARVAGQITQVYIHENQQVHRGDPIADIKLIEDPVKNLVVIMKDGKIYKNIL